MKRIILLAMLLTLVLMFGCTPMESGGETGTLVMQITDAPTELNIEKAMVTISNVQVHMAEMEDEEEMVEETENELTGAETAEVEETEMEEEETSSWFTVVEEAQTFDLMQLVDVTDVLGSAELDAGKYTQVRLTLESALVTIDGEEFDLTVPSEKIKLVKGFDIVADETTTLTIDFDAKKSIIAAGDKYILKPTVKVLSEEEMKGKSAEAGMPEETGKPEGKGKPEEVSYMDVTPAEAKELIDTTDIIVIDVSPKYDEGHLPGAINYYAADGSLDEAIPSLDPEATYLVYCHVDSVSILGAEKLIEAGFENVYRLEGNYAAWVDAGYDVE